MSVRSKKIEKKNILKSHKNKKIINHISLHKTNNQTTKQPNMAHTHRVLTSHWENNVVYGDDSHKNRWSISCVKNCVVDKFYVTAIVDSDSDDDRFRRCKVSKYDTLTTKNGLEIVYKVRNQTIADTFHYRLEAVLKKSDGSLFTVQSIYDCPEDPSMTDDDDDDDDDDD